MGMLDISSMVSPAKKPGGAVENLGKDFETWKFDQNWASDPGNDVVPMMLDSIYNNPQALAALGLTADDFGRQRASSGYGNPMVANTSTYNLSDKAKQALSGISMSRTGYAGLDDGRAYVIRDAAGNVLDVSAPFSYQPAKDFRDGLLSSAAAAAAFYGIGAVTGLSGATAGAAGAAGEAAGGGMLSGLDAAALDAGAGAVAGGAEAAGAAGAGAGAASGGALNAAAIESLAGTAGYGANAAADLFASSVGAGASGAGVSAFDSALAAIKNVGLNAVGAVSPGAASSLASGGDWLSQTFSAITGGSGTGGSLLGGLFSGSSALRDILGLVGAGVQQYNLEKMAKDNREWASAEKAKERRRQMPVTGAGLLGKFRVIPSGAGNGG